MASRKVLIADQNSQGAAQLGAALREKGYLVRHFAEKEPSTVLFEEAVASHMLVLDAEWHKERRSHELVRELRALSDVPIMILGAGPPDDRVACFEAGADDCVTRPFELRELMARIDGILRRCETREHRGVDQEQTYGEIAIYPLRRQVTIGTRQISLTVTEFDLLRLFLSTPNRPLSRDFILENLRGIEWEAVDRSIDILVSRLRDKLGDKAQNPRFIRTVRGVGYLFHSR